MTIAAGYGWARGVDVADVYKAGVLAGQLRRTSIGVSFSYTEDYVASRGRPVATTLPLTDVPMVTAAGAVPAFFAGLLPEGRRLTSLRRAVKTSADDDLSLLLAVGGDPVGDVQILAEGSDAHIPDPLVSVEQSFEEVTFRDILSASGVIDPVSIPGIQEKVSARMLSVPVGLANQHYILKLDPPEFPHVVANEAYFLSLAAKARFPVVRAQVVHDATGRPGLLVQRFDRAVGPDGRTVRLAVEDGAQLLGRYPADKYAVTAESLIVAVTRVCAATVVAARDVFRQLCFAWLTGNGDVHAKNVSVLATADGEWRVAPAYDLPATVPYGDHTMALPIAGRRDGLSRRHLLAFAASVGLPEAAAERTLDSVLAATAPVAQQWQDGAVPIGPRAARDVARVLRARRRAAERPATSMSIP